MNRIKAKPILLTMAVLVALCFLAVILLHKPDEPKIIGKFPQADVPEISKVAIAFERDGIRQDMKRHLGILKISGLWRDTWHYVSIKVISIEALEDGKARVTVGNKGNWKPDGYEFDKDKDGWKPAPMPFPRPPSIPIPPKAGAT